MTSENDELEPSENDELEPLTGDELLMLLAFPVLLAVLAVIFVIDDMTGWLG